MNKGIINKINCNILFAQSGAGTYVLNGFIYSSLLGRVIPAPLEDKENKNKNKDNEDSVLLAIQVVAASGKSSQQNGAVPAQGDIVTAKVLSVNPRYATLFHDLCYEIWFCFIVIISGLPSCTFCACAMLRCRILIAPS